MMFEEEGEAKFCAHVFCEATLYAIRMWADGPVATDRAQTLENIREGLSGFMEGSYLRACLADEEETHKFWMVDANLHGVVLQSTTAMDAMAEFYEACQKPGVVPNDVYDKVWLELQSVALSLIYE